MAVSAALQRRRQDLAQLGGDRAHGVGINLVHAEDGIVFNGFVNIGQGNLQEQGGQG